MKEFGSLGAFAAHLLTLRAAVEHEVHRGLEQVADSIEKTAKAEIGQYQDGIGPYDAWLELAESTKADRVRQGYSENDPGLRSGEMRDSISHQTTSREASIGSNDQNLVWFELGTEKQPPRSVFGPAVETSRQAIENLMASAIIRGLLKG